MGQGVLTMASRNMIMIWFDKNRGKVNSISSIAVSLGFSSSPIFISKLIDDQGWEMTWQILAICLFIFSFCIMQLYRDQTGRFQYEARWALQKNKTDKSQTSWKQISH